MGKDIMAFKGKGTCDICETNVTFVSESEWFRDYLLCSYCGSIPRERALMRTIKQFFPDFTNLVIHESSPIGRGVSTRLARECRHYTLSHYFLDTALGEIDSRTHARCENLEHLTFPDATFDLLITQDVMEHVFDPEAAFREIGRVLKPSGAHIFTVPLVNKAAPTRRRARRETSGKIRYLQEPEYHGNPVDPHGSLVTMDWGYDIASLITSKAGMPTIIIQIDDLESGIRAEYIDVVVSLKPGDDKAVSSLKG